MISYSKVLTIFSIGIGSAILLTMMLYAAFSQFFIDNVLYNIDANELAIAAIIILSFVFITFVSSFVISILVSTRVDKNRVFYSSIFTFGLLFVSLLGFSVLIIEYAYPHLIDDLDISGADYLFVLPAMCLFYLSTYVLDTFINLIIIIIVLYFLVFVIFLWIMERS